MKRLLNTDHRECHAKAIRGRLSAGHATPTDLDRGEMDEAVRDSSPDATEWGAMDSGPPGRIDRSKTVALRARPGARGGA